MGNCEDCGADIQDNYVVCAACAKNRKLARAKIQNKDIVDALSAINNNLYCVRRQLDVILKINHNVKIVWDKQKKDFVVQNE